MCTHMSEENIRNEKGFALVFGLFGLKVIFPGLVLRVR